jgi:hypothetical protein
MPLIVSSQPNVDKSSRKHITTPDNNPQASPFHPFFVSKFSSSLTMLVTANGTIIQRMYRMKFQNPLFAINKIAQSRNNKMNGISIIVFKDY